jgi:hypothetical protein
LLGTGYARRLVAQVMILCLLWPYSMDSARADLRSPARYNTSASATSLWHYRLPINFPAGTTVNSSIKIDVDFTALFAQMGLSDATLDVNSPRVARSTGARFERNLPMAH